MSALRNILVIRRDNIGDLICTTPLLTALRREFTEARIEVLANSYNAPVLEGNPDVDAIRVYSKLKHLAGNESGIAAITARAGMLWKLRNAKFDLAIAATGARDLRSLRLAKLAAVRRVVCADDPRTGQHEVERTFTAARKLGIDFPIPPLRVVPDAGSAAAMREVLRKRNVAEGQRMVAMHISARRPAQRWQAEKFAELSIDLHRNTGAATVLLWSPGTQDHAQHPGDDEKAARILSLVAGRAPIVPCPTGELRELIAALENCDAVVCSDGGAMHVAAGLGKPIACFFGDSEIARWRPWGVRHLVLHDSSDNVENIRVSEAGAAAAALLAP